MTTKGYGLADGDNWHDKKSRLLQAAEYNHMGLFRYGGSGYWQAFVESVVIIVSTAGSNINPAVLYVINQAVFFVDPPAEFTLQVTF